MSTELYEVLALAARYLFALLGVLIVLRAFFWLLTDHAERIQRIRQLPSAGMIGEFVVLAGDRDLLEGSTVAVPWEGILGSVRSSDVIIPCEGIHRKHLSFWYEPGKGLLLRPFSGCEAMVNGAVLTCRSRPEGMPMAHGSFLQVGNAVLRLRVFAGLDPAAGFQEFPPNAQPQSFPLVPASFPSQAYPVQDLSSFPPQQFPLQESVSTPTQSLPPQEPSILQSDAPSLPAEFIPESSNLSPMQESAVQVSVDSEASGPSRRRRSRRWEVDWSE